MRTKSTKKSTKPQQKKVSQGSSSGHASSSRRKESPSATNKNNASRKRNLTKDSIRNHNDLSKTSRQRPPGRAVVGIHSVWQVVKVRPQAVMQIWVKTGYQADAAIRQILQWPALGAEVVEVPTEILDGLAQVHQGICAFVGERPRLDWEALKKKEFSTVVALDQITDPQNLGAILRSSWLFGVDGLLQPADRSADLTPAAMKAASGGTEHVPIDIHNNLPRALDLLKEQGFWVFGLGFGETAKALWRLEIPAKVCWVVGAEGKGLRKSVVGSCDEIVYIPQVDPESSLNASVATSVALAETCRQRESS